MLILSTIILLLTSFQLVAQSKDEVNAAIIRVRQHLRQTSRQAVIDETKWLENSGKIGAGYDSVAGSPVCYSGDCQMEGFRQSIFKLNFTKQAEGSCTNKIIPQNVNLDCLPSMQITATTESISTLDELKESTKKGIEFSASASVFGNSFSYSHSTQTRSMIDTIIQKDSTVYFTRATISQMRLTVFEPLLELSDQFCYVIENMPCCNESSELDQYIREFIIDYFGLVYVKDLLLGGIAQQKIVISEENRKNLRENGFTTTDQAELKVAAASIFAASIKLTMTDEFDQTKLNTFKKFSQQSNIITLGGTTAIQSIEEWSKTVASNPTIIKFSVAPFLSLLTTQRFSSDPNIALKQNLIQKAQQKYTTSSLFCYNNCSQKGSCQPTGYFGFGQCHCNSGWSGIDCSIIIRAPTGLLANVYPGNTCPTGYTFGTYDLGCPPSLFACSIFSKKPLFPACSLADRNAAAGSSGTLCGIVFSSVNILCDNVNPYSEPCPSGYSKYSWVAYSNSPTTLYTCQKDNTSLNDRPGTLCGLHSNLDSGDQITCDGYYPGRGKCPSGYSLRQGTFPNRNSLGTLSLCVKD
jgi:hypothetical protein